METTAALQRDLVLLGGGHAHVLALRQLAMRPLGGLRITLVSPESHTPYSGMLPGLVAGHYTFEESHIDLERLCQWAGARFIRAAASGLRTERAAVELRDRPPLHYDLVSLDIGSEPELQSVEGAAEHVIPVKPVSGFWRRWQEFLGSLADSADQPRRVAVVGGGAGSVELVLAMARQLRPRPVSLVLCCAGREILAGYSARAKTRCREALERAGVSVEYEARVQRVGPGCLYTTVGEFAHFDEIFWCTAAAAAPWLADSGLACDERGFLLLRDTLQSESDPRVFAAGDIATQRAHPRPKAGVYAVRQGPVLAFNLRQSLLGRPLRSHRPQRRFLSLLSLGERRALADRGFFVGSGKWVWHWKDRIDRAFMRRFQDLSFEMRPAVKESLPDLTQSRRQAPCGGCGAKVAANELMQVLDTLRQRYPQASLGADQADDVACLSLGSGELLVQSVDVLRELSRDPWRMGQLAANHALSDLHASGACATSALAIVTLPFAAAPLQRRDLEHLLAGALSVFAEESCRLAGGHSLQGPELSLGFVVNGRPMAPERGLLKKRALRNGDCLLLTKPLGTGVLFAGAMQGLADGRDLAHAEALMLRSNRRAAEVALAGGATAATDVTGFGLLGHLQEMLQPGQTAKLELDALPALPGARKLLHSGVRSTAHEDNWRAGRSLLPADAAAREADWALACDPQTCGGLLLGVAPTQKTALLAALLEAGIEAALIGEVRPSALQIC